MGDISFIHCLLLSLQFVRAFIHTQYFKLFNEFRSNCTNSSGTVIEVSTFIYFNLISNERWLSFNFLLHIHVTVNFRQHR